MFSDRKACLLLALLVLALSLPFIGRAYFVDDYYHVTMAQGIAHHPLHPYDFVANDAGPLNKGWERGQPPRMVNPPLFHYILAGVMRGWGEESWKLRIVAIVFSVFGVWGMYFLGKRFLSNPFYASALLVVTPAFWLTSYSLLIDGVLLTFFLWSLLVFAQSQEKKSMALALGAGVLVGCTFLTKYTGILVFPVIVAWCGLEYKKGWSWRLTGAALAVAAGIIALWCLWTLRVYGDFHFLAAGRRGVSLHHLSVGKWMVMASFAGGAVVFFWPVLRIIFQQSRGAFLGMLVLWLGLFAVMVSPAGGFTQIQAVLMASFVTMSVSGLTALIITRAWDEFSSQRILLIWLLLGFLQLALAMQWIAARYLLIVLPPMCLLFQSLAERYLSRSWRAAAWASALVVGGAMAYGDYAQAQVIFPMRDILAREAATLESKAPHARHHWYYLGDTFTGYDLYLNPLGWEAAFPRQAFQPGDLLLRSRYRMPVWWRLPEETHLKLVAVWEFPSRWPVRVMDVPGSAGFYASAWGALPFTLTRRPLERFELLEVQ